MVAFPSAVIIIYLSILIITTTATHSTNILTNLTVPSEATKYFGQSLAVFNHTIFIGDHDALSHQGLVYIFHKNKSSFAWDQYQKLIIPELNGITAGFGNSISVTSERIIIGAKYNEAAYIFESIDGSYITLTPNTQPNTGCGSSVGIFKNVAFISCPFIGDQIMYYPGALYIYELKYAKWTQTAMFNGSTDDGFFGLQSGAIFGNTIIAIESDYILHIIQKINDEWSDTQFISPNKSFRSTTINGNTIAVGGHSSRDHFASNFSVIYLFTYNGISWHQTHTIPTPHWSLQYFAYSISLHPNMDVLAVSASENVYIYSFIGNIWVQCKHFNLPKSASNHNFKVSISGNLLTLSTYEPGYAMVYEVESWKPTIAPTSTPTSSPTLSPTNAPTHSPTRAPTKDTNKIFNGYIIVAYRIMNLDAINMVNLQSNTQVIIPYIENIIEDNYFDVNSLVYEEFRVDIDTETISYINKNVTLNCIIFCKSDVSGVLVSKTKSTQFEDGVTKDLREYFNVTATDNKLQFIVLNKDEIDAVVNHQNNSSKIVYIFFILSSVIIGSGIMLSLFVKCSNKRANAVIDNGKWLAPTIFALQVFDLYSDANLSYDILTQNEKTTMIWVCALINVICTVCPYITNIVYGITITQQATIQNNRRADEYFRNRIGILIILIAISGGCHPALMILSSRILSNDIFDCGLTQNELEILTKMKIKSTILMENIPQLFIQLLYAMEIGSITYATVFAAIGSLLSIIIAVSSYYANVVSQKKSDIVSYSLRFTNAEAPFNDVLTEEQQRKIKNNKGRKGYLERVIATIFTISYEAIEIGYVTVMNNGLEMNISHFVSKAVLKEYNNRLNEIHNKSKTYRMSIEPERYVNELYKKHIIAINKAFRNHFGIDDTTFKVEYINTAFHSKQSNDNYTKIDDLGMTQMNVMKQSGSNQQMQEILNVMHSIQTHLTMEKEEKYTENVQKQQPSQYKGSDEPIFD
eukprot:301487_1